MSFKATYVISVLSVSENVVRLFGLPPPPRAWLVYSYVLFFIFYLRPLGVTRLACDTLVDLVSFSCVWFFVLMCLVFLFPPKFRRSNLFRLLV